MYAIYVPLLRLELKNVSLLFKNVIFLHRCLQPLAQPEILLLQECDPSIRLQGVEHFKLLVIHGFLQDIAQPLELRAEPKRLILPLRVELGRYVVVFVGLKLFQKVGQREYCLRLEWHDFFLLFLFVILLRGMRMAGGAEGLIHRGGASSSLVEEALRLLETLIDVVELGQGLAILGDLVVFD